MLHVQVKQRHDGMRAQRQTLIAQLERQIMQSPTQLLA